MGVGRLPHGGNWIMPRTKKELDIPNFNSPTVPKITQQQLRVRERRIESKERYTNVMFFMSVCLLIFMIAMSCLLIGVWLKS